MGESYELRFDGEALIYRRASAYYDWGAPERIVPSDEQWRAFSKVLERESVWDWAADYPNPGVMDGTGWSLEIEWGPRAIATQGDSNYPGDAEPKGEAPFDASKRFIRFRRAVSRLIGRPFR